MSKKILIGLLVVFVMGALIFSAVAFAQERDATLEALHEQIYELRRQVVERRVELGLLTEEEGEIMLERMEERYLESLDEDSDWFYGTRGRGWGNGWGRGYGHCWR